MCRAYLLENAFSVLVERVGFPAVVTRFGDCDRPVFNLVVEAWYVGLQWWWFGSAVAGFEYRAFGDGQWAVHLQVILKSVG